MIQIISFSFLLVGWWGSIYVSSLQVGWGERDLPIGLTTMIQGISFNFWCCHYDTSPLLNFDPSIHVYVYIVVLSVKLNVLKHLKTV